jgi:hypothetical protein
VPHHAHDLVGISCACRTRGGGGGGGGELWVPVFAVWQNFPEGRGCRKTISNQQESAIIFHCAIGVLITLIVYERTKVWFIIQNSSLFPSAKSKKEVF